MGSPQKSLTEGSCVELLFTVAWQDEGSRQPAAVLQKELQTAACLPLGPKERRWDTSRQSQEA